jgi:hypothetical protein
MIEFAADSKLFMNAKDTKNTNEHKRENYEQIRLTDIINQQMNSKLFSSKSIK